MILGSWLLKQIKIYTCRKNQFSAGMDCAKLVILLVVCCLCGVWANEDGDVVVHISTGEVHGATGRTGRDHKIYYFFKGIPFGKVEKRFEVRKLYEH